MITTTYEITAGQLRKDDAIITGAQVGIVQSTDRKVKWTTILYTSGKKARVEVSTPLTVERLEKDETEKAAELKAYAVKRLTEMLKGGLVDTCAAEVRKALDLHDEKGWNIFSWGNLPTMLKAQAEHNLFLRIEHTRSTLVEKGLTEDVALLTAFARLEDHLDRSRMQDPTSRSTSTISNLMEDIDAYIVSEVSRKLEWNGISESIAQAKAEADAFFTARNDK